MARRCVEPVQAIMSGSPKNSIVINEYPRNNVVAKAVWFGGIMPESSNLAGGRIEAEKPVIICTNPEVARAVLAHRNRVGSRSLVGQPKVLERSTIAIDAMESTMGADPENSMMVFVDRTHERFVSVRGISEVATI